MWLLSKCTLYNTLRISISALTAGVPFTHENKAGCWPCQRRLQPAMATGVTARAAGISRFPRCQEIIPVQLSKAIIPVQLSKALLLPWRL